MLQALQNYREKNNITPFISIQSIEFNRSGNFVSILHNKNRLCLSGLIDGFFNEIKYFDNLSVTKITISSDFEEIDSNWVPIVCSVFPNVESFVSTNYIQQKGLLDVLRSFPKLKEIQVYNFEYKNRFTCQKNNTHYIIIEDAVYDQLSHLKFCTNLDVFGKRVIKSILVKETDALLSIEEYLKPISPPCSDSD